MTEKTCKICGQETQIYYKPWCPKCEKPEIQMIPQLNFIQCLKYLEANGEKGIEERLWDYFSDYFHNDSSFSMPLPPEVTPEDYSEQCYKDTLIVKNTWNIDSDHIEMYVSW